MIDKTEAIVLRHYPWSNTSRIVSWLTPHAGRMATLVKGSQRPKSPFLGQYDLFYTCELVFYGRERTGLHIARECAPLKTRARLREDWRACAAASYLADLASRISPPNAPHGELYHLLDAALDHLADSGVSPAFVFWFELKALDVLGLAPRLQHCLDCGNGLLPGGRHSKFCYARGGILCGACSKDGAPDSVPIAPDIVAMLAAWQRAQAPHAALNTRCAPRQLESLEKLLGLFLAYHLDTSLRSRAIALDVIRKSRQ